MKHSSENDGSKSNSVSVEANISFGGNGNIFGQNSQRIRMNDQSQIVVSKDNKSIEPHSQEDSGVMGLSSDSTPNEE